MIRRIALIFAVLLAVLPLGGSTRADLCLEVDPRTALAGSDGAFIGRLISREKVEGEERRSFIGEEVTWRFRVEQAVKGRIGREVLIESDGLEAAVGRRVGLLLDRRGEEWTSGACSAIEPDVLRRAAQPLPAPDSTGPVSFLITGRFGDVRTIALDRDARVVAYGKGQGVAYQLTVCEGSRRVVEVVHGAGRDSWRLIGLAVRDIETLEVVRELSLEELAGRWSPEGISCRDPAAKKVFVVGRDSDSHRIRVVSVRDNESSVVFDGPGRIASFSAKRDVAYLTAGKSVLELDMRGGRTKVLATLPLTPSSLALNHGESTLAGTNGSHPPQGRVFKVDLQSRAVSTVPGFSGQTVWFDDSRFAVIPGGDEVRVYDDALNVISSWAGWPTHEAVAVDRSLYSARGGRLVTASALRGEVRVLRELDSTEVFALVHVPSGPTRPAAGVRPGPLAIVLAVMALIVVFGLRQAVAGRHRQ